MWLISPTCHPLYTASNSLRATASSRRAIRLQRLPCSASLVCSFRYLLHLSPFLSMPFLLAFLPSHCSSFVHESQRHAQRKQDQRIPWVSGGRSGKD